MGLEIILVQLNAGGRIKFIIMKCVGDTVYREWGLVGGKSQTTSNTYDYINKGKSNELSPANAAMADYDRLIEARIKEGYIEVDSLDNIPSLEDPDMDFNDLPPQFCCSKPATSVSEKVCNKLIADNNAGFFVKENGSCHFILITPNDDVKIYTRRIEDHTRKYPHIVEAIKRAELLPNTLLIAELIVAPTDKYKTHMERFKRFQSISKSDTLKGAVKEDVSETLALQEETPAIAMVFNVLFLDGKPFTNRPYRYVFTFLQTLEAMANDTCIQAPKIVPLTSHTEAVKWAHKNANAVEGLVLWDMTKNAEITYNGKPNRRACYKIKPTREDDVVAYDWLEGSGAKQGKVGSLLIGKYNTDKTEIIPMGRVGSGLRIKEGECEIDYWDFPCVVEIKYDSRFDTGNYQFPRFIKKHEDKVPTDVVVDEDGM